MALLVVGLMPAVAFAQEALSPLQVAQIEQVASAAISPDGQHVAYTVSIPADPREGNDPNTQRLHIANAANGEIVASFTEAGVASVSFRPQHGTVTFLASLTEGEPRGLYEMAVTGGSPTRIAGHSANMLSYTWSPSGEHVAFVASEQLDAPTSPFSYRPTFYEENQAQRRAFVQRLADGTTTEFAAEGSFYEMAFSPDGSRLAAAVAPTPSVDDSFMAKRVTLFNAETGAVTGHIDNAGKLGQITWSPDGQRLALRAGNSINDPIDGRIMVVSADGGTPQNIWPEFEGKFEQIAWTGDDTIHVLVSESAEKAFGTIRPDGSGFERVVPTEVANWLSFDASDDGTVAFVANTAEHPNELFVMARGAEPTRLTTSNAWLANVPMGEQRVVRHPARDGAFEPEGVLILPVGFQEGTPVPMIVVVHGGPEAHYSNGWLTAYQMPGQMAAGRGYAVFYPNYRGSTGRGLAFIKSSQADLAGAEFDDIVDGVDYLIEQGIADAERIGVTGGSYGGYATAWMSTRYSERFAAGVMFVGISNNLSKWGTSDIPDELYLVHSRERMWENDEKWMDYLRRSPIYHVENAQTPLLIMHGAEDTRVHPAQSMELYRHIKVRRPDTPVRLIYYPGEGHGNVRAASRLDYTLRMMGWFDSYLMGDGEMPSLDIELPTETAATN